MYLYELFIIYVFIKLLNIKELIEFLKHLGTDQNIVNKF